MMHLHPKSEVLLIGDIRNILTALMLAAQAQPDGEYQRGWLAALVAAGRGLGAIDDDGGPAFMLPGGRR